MVVSSLKPGIVTLMKNMNGNHVAQRCLQHLTPQYREVRITCLVHLISFQLSMCINRYICVKKKKKRRCLPLLYAKLQTSQPVYYTSPSRGHILKVKAYKDYVDNFFLKKLDFIYM